MNTYIICNTVFSILILIMMINIIYKKMLRCYNG